MSVALQLEPPDPVAEARARYQGELDVIVDELAAELGYTPGTFLAAARNGWIAETDETRDLLVAARVLA